MNIMNYGKARGINLLFKYLPKASPFEAVDIFQTMEDWEKIKNKYGEFTAFRIDMPIGKPMKSTIGTSGICSDVPRLIEQAKKQDKNAAILVMKTKKAGVPRYLYDGGFNILFNLGKEVIFEFSGRAFDGHELTQGLVVHERYLIDWKDIYYLKDRNSLIKLTNLAGIKTTLEQYANQRKERVIYLTQNCGYDQKIVEENVPINLELVKESGVRSLIEDIVFELFKQKEELRKDRLIEFAVQGNFVNGKAEPWEIFRWERWL